MVIKTQKFNIQYVGINLGLYLHFIANFRYLSLNSIKFFVCKQLKKLKK